MINEMTKMNLLNYAALTFLFFSIWQDWYWPWGLLFLYWTLAGLRSGEVYLVSAADRSEAPVLFWVITILWVLLSVSMIVADLFPAHAPWLR